MGSTVSKVRAGGATGSIDNLAPYPVRAWHVLFGHEHVGATMIDKLRSNKHPQNDATFIYTVNVMRCRCGLHFLDDGMEFRDDSWKK